MIATCGWITKVICAHIVVITRNWGPLTFTICTNITLSAGISIITGISIWNKHTAPHWIAGIVCAGVTIVTRNRSPITSAVYALITCCTDISIITGRTIHWGKYTSPYWIAGIFCAGVIIVTRNWGGPLTFTICTNITLSAGISIITGFSIWNKHTARYWITGIVCTGVIIVTRNKSPLTYTICTTVINCTFVPVITED
jgi:hypothetical protein